MNKESIMLKTATIVSLLLLSACGSGATLSSYQAEDATVVTEGPLLHGKPVPPGHPMWGVVIGAVGATSAVNTK